MLTPEKEANLRQWNAQSFNEGHWAREAINDLLTELDYTRMLLKDALETRGESLEEVQRLRQENEALKARVAHLEVDAGMREMTGLPVQHVVGTSYSGQSVNCDMFKIKFGGNPYMQDAQ